MSIESLTLSEQIKFEKRRRNKVSRLKTIRKLGIINRMLCLTCVLPCLYAAACLGQNKTVPTVSKIGSIGFVASIVGAFVLKEKEEEAVSDLSRFYEQYYKMGRQAV